MISENRKIVICPSRLRICPPKQTKYSLGELRSAIGARWRPWRDPRGPRLFRVDRRHRAIGWKMKEAANRSGLSINASSLSNKPASYPQNFRSGGCCLRRPQGGVLACQRQQRPKANASAVRWLRRLSGRQPRMQRLSAASYEFSVGSHESGSRFKPADRWSGRRG